MTVSDGQTCLGHRALLPSTKRVVRVRSLLQGASDSIPGDQTQTHYLVVGTPAGQ